MSDSKVSWWEHRVETLDEQQLLLEIRAAAKRIKDYQENIGGNRATIPLDGEHLLLLRMCEEIEAVLPHGALGIEQHPTAPKKKYLYFELAPPKLCNNDYTWHRADEPCPECERGWPPKVLRTFTVEEVHAYMHPIRATASGVEHRTSETAMEYFRQKAEEELGRHDIELTWAGDPGESAISVAEVKPPSDRSQSSANRRH